jgi:exodeoxyribonuclease VII large subunit
VITGVNRTLHRVVGSIWMEGEVLSLKRPSSGHMYFGLKDQRSQISAVLWRGDAQRLGFEIAEGMTLRCRVRLGLYERDGKFQVYVQAVEQSGVGADAAAFEELKRRLAAAGLFDAARKRPLPLLPRSIGVVTSRTGAAVRDIIRAVQRRFPVPILIADTRVQGRTAPRQIAHALDEIARAGVDVIIVGRGGGSAADLAAFNDERVVRKVARMPVPVISAVGHEVDISLTDLAADHRAATPTMAGEMAVPVLAELADALRKLEQRLGRELQHQIHVHRQEIDVLGERLGGRLRDGVGRRRRQLADLIRAIEARHPRVRLSESRRVIDELDRRAHTAIAARLSAGRLALGRGASELSALSPLGVLERGYAIARDGERVITSAETVAPGDRLDIRLRRGRLTCQVETVFPDGEE